MKPIDLRSSDETLVGGAIPASPGDSCPSVYLYGSKDLAELPKEGRITFEFKREELSVRDGESKPVRAVLKLKAILDFDEADEEEEPEEDEDDLDMDSGEALDRKVRAALPEEEIED